jgi:hypothetical protein
MNDRKSNRCKVTSKIVLLYFTYNFLWLFSTAVVLEILRSQNSMPALKKFDLAFFIEYFWNHIFFIILELGIFRIVLFY